MKVFVAGASGAIGRQLVPLLIAAGHEVVAGDRQPRGARAIDGLGATVVVDRRARPPLARRGDSRRRARGGRPPDDRARRGGRLPQLRRGVRAHEPAPHRGHRPPDAGRPRRRRPARRGAELRQLELRAHGRAREDGERPARSRPARVDAADARGDPPPRAAVTQTAGVDGVALRYGNLYGPGTSIAPDGDLVEQVRRRRLPVVGDGAGVWSFVHVEDAASATLAAIEHGRPGIYNVVRRRARGRARVAARSSPRRRARSRRGTFRRGSAAWPPARPPSRCSPRSAAPATRRRGASCGGRPRTAAGGRASGASCGRPSWRHSELRSPHMLYGRDAERSRIGQALDGARESRSAVLVLRGEPGVGKSALLEEARGLAAGMRVLRGRGIESEAQIPYAGLHQLLRPGPRRRGPAAAAAGARAARRARPRRRHERRVVPRLARRAHAARRGGRAGARAVPGRRRALARRGQRRVADVRGAPARGRARRDPVRRPRRRRARLRGARVRGAAARRARRRGGGRAARPLGPRRPRAGSG